MIVYASGVVRGTDNDGDSQPVAVVGGDQDALKTSDMDQQDILTDLVKELKIMNMHLSLITDTSIHREDVEV